jgi:hypothetical protein
VEIGKVPTVDARDRFTMGTTGRTGRNQPTVEAERASREV